MEPDSTTHEKHPKALIDEPNLPFITSHGNLKLYKEFIDDNGNKSLENQIVERMQSFGLLPNSIKCPSDKPDCKVICRPARVVDRVQWVCDGCGKRQPIRDGSFFFRLQCSIVQALQIILGWCQDADCNIVAEHFGVKLKVVSQIYEKLDDLAIKEYNKHRLGGVDSVVLAEMYPDCLNRLSPDTTDQPHVHRIVMLADTKHVPTYYRLHVIKEDPKKTNADMEKVGSDKYRKSVPLVGIVCISLANFYPTLPEASQFLDIREYDWVAGTIASVVLVLLKLFKKQIDEIISESVDPESFLVTGHNMPPIEDASPISHMTRYLDAEMEHFLSSGIWRQAIILCSASRDICARATLPAVCAPNVQRYLQASLYRLRYGDGFYYHMLKKIAEEYTRPISECFTVSMET